jgi:hypothetical protein
VRNVVGHNKDIHDQLQDGDGLLQLAELSLDELD